MIPKNTLIYTIENDVFKYFSYHHDNFNQCPISENEKIISIIANHKFLVGFNNKEYSLNTKYKRTIDLKQIIEQRQNSIKHKDSVLTYHLRDTSLSTITSTLNINNNNENLTLIKNLWEWIFNHFDNWKHHLTTTDAQNLIHITCDPTVYAYKVICKKANLREEYTHRGYENDFTSGGYVSYPSLEKCEGNIYCLDFASIYSNIMIQCNIFGRNKIEDKGWNKYNILGYYNTEKMSKISQALLEINKERKSLKDKGDKKEHGLKITQNIIYGLLRSSTFKSVYDEVAGNDVCIIAQHFIKYTIKQFKENNYNVFYADTDSIYFKDTYNNPHKFLALKDKILGDIKSTLPFPSETFDIDIDYKIDVIHFFKPLKAKKEEYEELDKDDKKAKELGLLKKNYMFIYEKEDGTKDLLIKNLGIVKRSNTQLSKRIVYEKMKPIILKTHKFKFPNSQIKEWIQELLTEDPTLLAKRIVVKHINSYKSKSCIQAQVHEYIPQGQNKPLGYGTYFLLPNKKIGVGKSNKKYCTIEEYKNNLNYNDLDLEVIMKELSYFNENYQPEKTQSKKQEASFFDSLRQQGLW